MQEVIRTAAVASTLALQSGGSAWAQVGERYHHHGDMMGPWAWFGGVLMMLIFIGLIVGAVVLTLRLLGYGPTGRSSGRALDILKERFARGEIDKAEFEERRRALQESGNP